MFIYKQLKVTFDYPPEFDKHNHELVGYVIQRYPRRVLATAILTRESVLTWYNRVKEKYSKSTHVILLGAISLIGMVDEIVDADSVEEEKPFYQPSAAKRDPSAN